MMREEVANWWKQAEKDLKAAKDSFNTNNFDWASFQAQQASEKALKALLIKSSGKFPKIHDLVRLGEKVGLPEKYLEKCKELTLVYVYTRYPDVSKTINFKKDVGGYIKLAKEILEWVKAKL